MQTGNGPVYSTGRHLKSSCSLICVSITSLQNKVCLISRIPTTSGWRRDCCCCRCLPLVTKANKRCPSCNPFSCLIQDFNVKMAIFRLELIWGCSLSPACSWLLITRLGERWWTSAICKHYESDWLKSRAELQRPFWDSSLISGTLPSLKDPLFSYKWHFFHILNSWQKIKRKRPWNAFARLLNAFKIKLNISIHLWPLKSVRKVRC